MKKSPTVVSNNMGAAYQILGRAVQPHQLAIATLSLVVVGVAPKPWSGSSAPSHPQINSSSPEEEKFVKEWLAKHEKL